MKTKLTTRDLIELPPEEYKRYQRDHKKFLLWWFELDGEYEDYNWQDKRMGFMDSIEITYTKKTTPTRKMGI